MPIKNIVKLGRSDKIYLYEPANPCWRCVLNTRDLEYFAKLVEIKNFSAVADHFGVSQPTVSLALKRLETSYGIELLHRDQSHNTLTVTPAGRQFARHVRVILGELQQADSELAGMQTETVRLGLPPIIGNFYLPTVIPRLVEENLMTHLQTVEAGSAELLHQLRSGEVDMALLGSAGPLADDDLRVHEISATPFAIITSPKRELSLPLDVHALANTPFIAMTEGFVHDQVFTAMRTKANINPPIAFRTSDFQLLKQMVAQDVGVALLATLALRPEDGLRVIPLLGSGQPRFSIAVVTRKQQLLSPIMRKLQQTLEG